MNEKVTDRERERGERGEREMGMAVVEEGRRDIQE